MMLFTLFLLVFLALSSCVNSTLTITSSPPANVTVFPGHPLQLEVQASSNLTSEDLDSITFTWTPGAASGAVYTLEHAEETSEASYTCNVTEVLHANASAGLEADSLLTTPSYVRVLDCPTPSGTASSTPPALLPAETFIDNDTLHVAFTAPLSYANVSYGVNASCWAAIEAASQVVAHEGNCSATHKLAIDWSDVGGAAAVCGDVATREEAGALITYTLSFGVTAVEYLDFASSWVERTVGNPVAFKLQFNTQVSVSRNITVTAPPSAQLIIDYEDEEEDLPSRNGVLRVPIRVSHADSVRLHLPEWDAYPDGATPRPVESADGGATWVLLLDTDKDVCHLSGTLAVTWTISCVDEGACPLSSAERDSDVRVQVPVTASSLCPSLADNVALSSSFAAFSDAAHENQVISVGGRDDVLHLRAMAIAGETIASVTLDSVFVEYMSGDTGRARGSNLLVVDGAVTDGAAVQLGDEVVNRATQKGRRFTLQLVDLPPDASRVTLSASLKVAFENAAFPFAYAGAVMSLSVTDGDDGDTSANSQGGGSGQGSTLVVVGIVIVVVAVALGLLYLALYKKSDKPAPVPLTPKKPSGKSVSRHIALAKRISKAQLAGNLHVDVEDTGDDIMDVGEVDEASNAAAAVDKRRKRTLSRGKSAYGRMLTPRQSSVPEPDTQV